MHVLPQLPGPSFFQRRDQELPDDGGVCGAPHLPHHLTDQESDRVLFAVLIVGDRGGILIKRCLNDHV